MKSFHGSIPLCCCHVSFSHRMAGEQRCRHQVRNNCGEIMLQAHKHSPAATHHRCEHQNSQHSDSSRDFSWRNYGEILEDDGSRTVMVILVTGYGAIIKWDLITDKRRWRGLLIVNCSCNLLVPSTRWIVTVCWCWCIVIVRPLVGSRNFHK